MRHTLKNISSEYWAVIPLLVFLFSLPFSHQYCKVPLWAIFPGIIIYFAFQKKIKVTRTKYLWAVLPALHLLYSLSFFYSANEHEALRTLNVMAWMWVIPLAYWLGHSVFNKYQKHIYIAFTAGVFISILLSWAIFVYNGYVTDIYQYLTNEEQRTALGFFELLYDMKISYFMHRTYASFHVLLAMVFLVRIKIKPGLKLIGFLVFSLHIYLLNSRAAIAGLVLFVLIGIWNRFQVRPIFKGLTALLLAGIVVFLLVYFSRFSKNFDSFSDIYHGDSYTEDIRAVIWQNSIDVWKQQPIIGVGVGDFEDELYKNYEKNGYPSFITKRLDAHNQFLETGGSIGVIGFVFLILMFIFPLLRYYKNHAFALFLLFSVILFSIESAFMHISGLLYWAFFYTFFLLQSESQRKAMRISDKITEK